MRLNKELDVFIKSAANKFEELYRLHGKGRDKYSHFYYHWLQYQIAVVSDALSTCRHDDITDENKCLVLIGVAISKPGQPISKPAARFKTARVSKWSVTFA